MCVQVRRRERCEAFHQRRTNAAHRRDTSERGCAAVTVVEAFAAIGFQERMTASPTRTFRTRIRSTPRCLGLHVQKWAEEAPPTVLLRLRDPCGTRSLRECEPRCRCPPGCIYAHPGRTGCLPCVPVAPRGTRRRSSTGYTNRGLVVALYGSSFEENLCVTVDDCLVHSDEFGRKIMRRPSLMLEGVIGVHTAH